MITCQKSKLEELNHFENYGYITLTNGEPDLYFNSSAIKEYLFIKQCIKEGRNVSFKTLKEPKGTRVHNLYFL